MQAKTQLIAHDKEVYDLAFASGVNVFASVGADGSVRVPAAVLAGAHRPPPASPPRHTAAAYLLASSFWPQPAPCRLRCALGAPAPYRFGAGLPAPCRCACSTCGAWSTRRSSTRAQTARAVRRCL